MFRTITSPSSGASSHKLYNALVCSCYQASLTVAWNTCWILAYCHFCVLSLIYLVAHMDVDIYFNIYICWYCDCRTCCLLLYLPVLYLLLVIVTFLTFLVWWNMVTERRTWVEGSDSGHVRPTGKWHYFQEASNSESRPINTCQVRDSFNTDPKETAYVKYLGSWRTYNYKHKPEIFKRTVLYEGWNFNFGNAAVTFDTAYLHSSYFHRPSMFSPKLCRTRSQRWGSRMMPLAAPVLLIVRTERSTAEGLNPPCNCPIR